MRCYRGQGRYYQLGSSQKSPNSCWRPRWNPDPGKEMETEVFGHVTRSFGLAKAILQDKVIGKRRGRQRNGREGHIKEWTGMDFASSNRTAENSTRWKEIVAKSSVVPWHLPVLWNRTEKNIIYFSRLKSLLQMFQVVVDLTQELGSGCRWVKIEEYVCRFLYLSLIKWWKRSSD